MIEALINGERDPVRCWRSWRAAGCGSKIPDLKDGVLGRLGDQHAMMCRLHLDHIDYLVKTIAGLETRIEAMRQPFGPPASCWSRSRALRRSPRPRSSPKSARTSPGFPAAGHLASWAGPARATTNPPGNAAREDPERENQLCPSSWGAPGPRSVTTGYLKSLYHRHVMRNGGYRNPVAKGKAIFTVAHAILVIIWNILATGLRLPGPRRRGLRPPRRDPEPQGPAAHRPGGPRQARHPARRRRLTTPPPNPAPLELRRVAAACPARGPFTYQRMA